MDSQFAINYKVNVEKKEFYDKERKKLKKIIYNNGMYIKISPKGRVQEVFFKSVGTGFGDKVSFFDEKEHMTISFDASNAEAPELIEIENLYGNNKYLPIKKRITRFNRWRRDIQENQIESIKFPYFKIRRLIWSDLFLGYNPSNENEFIQNINASEDIYFNDNFTKNSEQYYHEWDSDMVKKLSSNTIWPDYMRKQAEIWENLKENQEITTIQGNRVKIKLKKDAVRKFKLIENDPFNDIFTISQLKDFPPAFSFRKTLNQLEEKPNLYAEDPEYPSNFQYKTEYNGEGKIIKKIYNDGVVEEFNEDGEFKIIHYTKYNVKIIFENGKARLEPSQE
ncbi:hypothetical protein [Candidatus Phytoplasma pruni]|uniref:Uncharacterized protein n=1 Tax=Candidatus Phytoplasma pruni TaxID=479893 RepID=A0A851HJR4_9MOLU|nr:hypothetical protein [Candidatus Phytoplasma pruni]NWN46073.1 hypothetical protein [Candidatus Phytoplasma pruni]